MQAEIRIASEPFVHCATEISISGSGIDGGPPLTLMVRTGAAYLQTYATREEIRSLASALLRVANEVSHATA